MISKTVVSFLLSIAISIAWAFNLLTPFGSVPVAFAATGGIAGNVEYFNNTAISGATVVVKDSGSATAGTAATDSSGNFSVTGLVPGSNYSVTVTYSTTSATVQGISVSSGQTTTLSSSVTLGSTGWIACDTVITTDCVQSLKDADNNNITAARAQPRRPPAPFSFVLDIPVYGVDSSGNTVNEQGQPYRELANLGFSTNDTFNIEILLSTFEPTAFMVDGGDLLSWAFDSTTKVLSIDVKPVAISRALPPNTCDVTSCVNQADVDVQVYLHMGTVDMSQMPLSEMPGLTADEVSAFASKVKGGYISTNAQYVSTPSMRTGDNTYEFGVGAPHLKKDGSVNTGFFKIFMPDAVLQHMWNVSGASGMVFDMTVTTSGGPTSTSQLSATVVQGGVLMEHQNFNYSVNQVNLSPTTATPIPAGSEVGLGILAGLFALLLIWAIQRRRRQFGSLRQ